LAGAARNCHKTLKGLHIFSSGNPQADIDPKTERRHLPLSLMYFDATPYYEEVDF
jgi:hypothetical protein